jgi:glycosyltransferase involved in cell wall biosynthesis
MILIVIAWIVIGFTMFQLLTATLNALSGSKLPHAEPGKSPFISVLIPARNEEKNIANLLNDILNQDYSNYEVIVFNDQSTDSTPQIVGKFSDLSANISLVDSESLPAGWLGKNWACHSLSKKARGEFLLFLDADVRIGNGLLNNAASYAERNNISLISIFPRQIIKTMGEKLTVPLMNYILLSLLPLILVRKTSVQSLAAANGQFMFFNSEAYNSVEPHKMMKNNMVEDIEISRMLKRKKYRVACLIGDESICCRMYEGFDEAVHGFSKNVAAFFGNSLFLAALFWLITTFGFLFILFGLSPAFMYSYLLAFFLIRGIISYISEQSMTSNLLLSGIQQLTCGLFIFSALRNKYLKNYQWKGRYID